MTSTPMPGRFRGLCWCSGAGQDRAVNLRLRGDMAKLADHQNIRRIDLPSAGHCANFDMHDPFCAALVDLWEEAGQLLPRD